MNNQSNGNRGEGQGIANRGNRKEVGRLYMFVLATVALAAAYAVTGSGVVSLALAAGVVVLSLLGVRATIVKN